MVGGLDHAQRRLRRLGHRCGRGRRGAALPRQRPAWRPSSRLPRPAAAASAAAACSRARASAASRSARSCSSRRRRFSARSSSWRRRLRPGRAPLPRGAAARPPRPLGGRRSGRIVHARRDVVALDEGALLAHLDLDRARLAAGIGLLDLAGRLARQRDLLALGTAGAVRGAQEVEQALLVGLGQRVVGRLLRTPADCSCSSSAAAGRFSSAASWATVVTAIVGLPCCTAMWADGCAAVLRR